jgi:RNA polymerase-binding transcription factor DksA
MTETAATSANELSANDVALLRRRLLQMRAELEARHSERDVLQLKRVEAALSKMARGGYGNCESCSRPLLKHRLLESPHVRYCAVCSGGRISPPSRGRAPAPRGPASPAAS